MAWDFANSGDLEGLFERIDSGEVALTTGSDGLLSALRQGGLGAWTGRRVHGHLGYVKGEPTAVARGNARNGTTTKTISSPGSARFETRGGP